MKVRHENGLQGASTSQVHLEVVPESEVARIPTEASGDNVSRFANLSTTAVVGPSGISNFGDLVKHLQEERLKYPPRSLGFFTYNNWVRKKCMWLIEHSWFDQVIMLIIAANCIILAQMDPRAGHENSKRNLLIEESEPIFTFLFTMEATFKIIAMGLILDSRSYLRDGWNVMDFMVVMVSLISLLPILTTNVSAVRTLRVLRPLRTLSLLPGMRDLINTMLNALPMLGNVILLSMFLFVVFGILGVQLFKGALRNRCHYVDWDAEEGARAPLLLPEFADVTCTNYTSSYHGRNCNATEGMYCLYHGNPHNEVTSFDNIFYAFITIFQCITLEGWTVVMYMCQDATSTWAWCYFLSLIFLGSFFLINLALAVVSETYKDENLDSTRENQEQAMEELDKVERERTAEMELKDNSTDVMLVLQHNETHREASARDLESPPEGQEDQEGTPQANIRTMCLWVVEQWYFQQLVTLCIVINTVLLSAEYDSMSESFKQTLATCNLVLTIFFTVEMLLKLIGLQVRTYFKDSFNTFDALVVVVSVLELCISQSGSFSAMRAFRILRIMKLVRSWRSLHRFLVTMYVTIRSLGNFLVIVSITIFILALLGMQTFGGKMDQGDGLPRHHFDDLFASCITVFQLLTGEDWNYVMYDGVQATSMLSVMYFVITIVVGNYLVLNLFVAILLANFAAGDSNLEKERAREAENLEEQSQELSMPQQSIAMLKEQFKVRLDKFKALTLEHRSESFEERFDPLVLERWGALANLLLDRERLEAIQPDPDDEADGASSPAHRSSLLGAHGSSILRSMSNKMSEHEARILAKSQSLKKKLIHRMEGYKRSLRARGNCSRRLELYNNKSLFLFTPDSEVRKVCYRIVDDRKFDFCILSLIVISSAFMAYEHPRLSDSEIQALFAADVVFTIVFFVEMALKIVALGLWKDDDTYLMDPWNVLDGTVVCMGIFSMLLSGSQAGNLGWVRSLRTIRVVRPLRVIHRVPELKVVVNALFKSIPELGNVFVVSLLFWLIFGILGMQLFMGKFVSCSDPETFHKDDCHGYFETTKMAPRWLADGVCSDEAVVTAEECRGYHTATLLVERKWVTADSNFNNIFKAMQTLFEMSTTEGWTQVMYNGMDATGRDTAMRRDNQRLYAIFFLVFMVMGNFFLLNLFVGIILDNFTRQAEEEGEGGRGTVALMTKEQRTWVTTHRRISSMRAKQQLLEPENDYQRAVFKVVTSHAFDWIMLLCIVANAVFMGLEHYKMTDSITNLIETMNFAFTIVFTVEAFVKVIGLGLMPYFSERWNQFDFVVVSVSLIGLGTQGGFSASILRILRIARLFRVAKSLRGLRMLFETLVVSLPSLANVGGLMILVMVVYAILGVNLFGKVKYGEALTPSVNFRTFGSAMMLLMRTATGEAWNAIMYDAMVSQDCDSSEQCELGTCCGTEFGAAVYFISFTIVGSFVMLNLLIAVVLENFSTTKKADAKKVTDEDLKAFGEVWRLLDPNATNMIPLEAFPTLVEQLRPPLGLNKGKNSVSRTALVRFQRECTMLRISHPTNLEEGPDGEAAQPGLDYSTVLQCLTMKAYGVDWGQLPAEVQESLDEDMRKLEKKRMQQLQRENKGVLFRVESMARGGVDRGARRMQHGSSIRLACKLSRDRQSLERREEITVAHVYAARLLQAAFRGYLERKRMRLLKEQKEGAEQHQRAEQVMQHIHGILQVASDEFHEANEHFQGSDLASDGDSEAFSDYTAVSHQAWEVTPDHLQAAHLQRRWTRDDENEEMDSECSFPCTPKMGTMNLKRHDIVASVTPSSSGFSDNGNGHRGPLTVHPLPVHLDLEHLAHVRSLSSPEPTPFRSTSIEITAEDEAGASVRVSTVTDSLTNGHTKHKHRRAEISTVKPA